MSRLPVARRRPSAVLVASTAALILGVTASLAFAR